MLQDFSFYINRLLKKLLPLAFSLLSLVISHLSFLGVRLSPPGFPLYLFSLRYHFAPKGCRFNP